MLTSIVYEHSDVVTPGSIVIGFKKSELSALDASGVRKFALRKSN